MMNNAIELLWIR